MRTKRQDPPVISRLRKDISLTPFSKIANLRCPECNALQPMSRMSKTNPHKGWNKYDAHQCNGCGDLLYLTGKGRLIHLFTLTVPVCFIGFVGGFELISNIEWLSYYNEARSSREPNFPGGLIGVFCFLIIPALALMRFEEIKVLEISNAH